MWRKLKRLGAILIHDAVWALPATSRSREEMRWLAVEIIEHHGDALVWDAELHSRDRDEALVASFLGQVDEEYAAIRDDLKRGIDPTSLSQRFQQARSRDYFNSALGAEVRHLLMSATGER